MKDNESKIDLGSSGGGDMMGAVIASPKSDGPSYPELHLHGDQVDAYLKFDPKPVVGDMLKDVPLDLKVVGYHSNGSDKRLTLAVCAICSDGVDKESEPDGNDAETKES